MLNEKFPGKIEIPMGTAIEWAKKFRNSKSEEASKIDAYLIPLESLEAVLKLKNTLKIDAVRAYVGINDAGEQNLMFVGAKFDADTGIYKDVFSDQATAKTSKTSSTVYDGSRPCPPCTDPSSPLY